MEKINCAILFINLIHCKMHDHFYEEEKKRIEVMYVLLKYVLVLVPYFKKILIVRNVQNDKKKKKIYNIKTQKSS